MLAHACFHEWGVGVREHGLMLHALQGRAWSARRLCWRPRSRSWWTAA